MGAKKRFQKCHRFNVSLDYNDWVEFSELCVKQDKKVSAVIRAFMKEYIAKEGKKQ